MKQLYYKLRIIILISIALLIISSIQAKENNQSKYSKIDYRIVSQSYWLKMAKLGLVELAPMVPIKKAVYKSNKIDAPFLASNYSTDIPVTTHRKTVQSENSVFIDPNDKDIILNSNNSAFWACSTVTEAYGADAFYSTDGGKKWDGSINGVGGSNYGDPAAVIDLDGRYYVGYIDTSLGQGVAHSTNGGITWTHIQVAAGIDSFLDKNHLWVDNSSLSAYKGNLYSAWTNFFGTDDGDIQISRSTNTGIDWSIPINISSAVNEGGFNQGVNIQTGPSGEVYAAWAIYDSLVPPYGKAYDETAIGFTRSLDGGATFEHAWRSIDNIRGIRYTKTSKSMRVNSFPAMTVDNSIGPHGGNIYIVWANYGYPGVNDGPDIDIYMIMSTDKGSTWSSEPTRVNQDPLGKGKEHYFPWITCDPASGKLFVIFYDDRDVSSTDCEVFVACSADGGTTWCDFKVSDVSFTPSPVPGLADGYFGDYLGISAREGKVYPAWTDNRSGRALTYVSPFVVYEQIWCVHSLNLFQDNFSTDGTATGTGRADTAMDILPETTPGILPGDSAVVTVCAPAFQIAYHDQEDPTSGAAIYGWISVLPVEHMPATGDDLEERDPVNEPGPGDEGERWPYRDSEVIPSNLWGSEEPPRNLTWHQMQMDTCFAHPGRSDPVANRFCIDLNENYFVAGDTILFFFHARNMDGSDFYWSEFTETTQDSSDVANDPMEFQILPTSSNSDILYVDNFEDTDARYYFNTAFQMLQITPDRYDVRYPSLNAGNGPGSRVVSVTQQLIPSYRVIIWNSGNLHSGTVGDGTGNPDKEDDWGILFAFVDLHSNSNGSGIYFSGNDLAEEWSGLLGPSAVNFKSAYMNFNLEKADHRVLGQDYPFAIGESESIFEHPETGADTMIVWDGCSEMNDFDVLSPYGSATGQMTYNDPGNLQAGAVLTQASTNINENPVGVVLSGFSFSHIWDDVPAGIPDRTDHLTDILNWLMNQSNSPTAIGATTALANNLLQNYPNPFNPSTTIKYSIKDRAHVSLKIYNVAGFLVRTLVNEKKIPGVYTVKWNSENNSGDPVASGVYFYRLVTKEFTKTRKLVVLK